MISVIIPTLNSELDLPRTLSALIPAAVEGIVKEVLIVDGGSQDFTLNIADNSGAKIINCERGRGKQLKAGAQNALYPWLLFLHADTELMLGWERIVMEFIERIEHNNSKLQAASFRFKLSDVGLRPKLLEALVSIRCRLLKLPYGDQGLLIPRILYNEVKGYSCLPIMEDVDLVSRVGRKRICILPVEARTSARRYQNEGYFKRILRNQLCLLLYLIGVKAELIARIYENNPK